MRILIYAEKVAPSVGGVEEATRLLAKGLTDLGCHLTIVTNQLLPTLEVENVRVISQPRPWEVYSYARKSDGVIMQGLALKFALWAALANRPTILVRQTRPMRRRWPLSMIEAYLESRMIRVGCSEYMAGLERQPAAAIANPYDADVFVEHRMEERPRDLIWVGRMIEDKGPGHLIEAWKQLRCQNVHCSLTFVGVGPYEREVSKFIESLGEQSLVRFLGPLKGVQLANEMRCHKILVVPSVWDEPFGIVALEGIGCGCMVIGFAVGGLAEAIGPCGITVPRGNVEELAAAIPRLLFDEELRQQYRKNAASHLAKHHPQAVATAFLDIFSKFNESSTP